MRITRTALHDGYKVPGYLGRAWDDYLTDEVIFFPIPINLIARLFHEAYFRARCHSKSALERYLFEHITPAVNRAYDDGYRYGYDKRDHEARHRYLMYEAEIQRWRAMYDQAMKVVMDAALLQAPAPIILNKNKIEEPKQ